MAGGQEVPVILKLYDLMLWTLNHTARFPRHHRYSLGTKIEATLLELLDVLIEARYVREKTALLDRANIVLERFRFQMRLAKDLKVLAPNSFEFQAKAVEEIGRMLGGWRKHAAQAPSPPPGLSLPTSCLGDGQEQQPPSGGFEQLLATSFSWWNRLFEELPAGFSRLPDVVREGFSPAKYWAEAPDFLGKPAEAG